MKDIKKLLKDNSCAVLPDKNIKENIKNDLGIQDRQVQQVVAYNDGNNTTTVRKNMSLIYVMIALLLVAIIVGGILLSIGGGSDPFNNGKFDAIKTTDDFYAYGVASVGALINQHNATPSEMSYNNNQSDLSSVGIVAMSTQKTANSSVLTDRQVAIVNSYMPLVEDLLGNSKIEHQNSQQTIEGYKYCMNVVYKDITGNTVNYIMYYNKELLNTNSDGDEQENNYAIEGIMLIGTTNYPVEGSYQTENEQGEQESEMWFKAYTAEDRSSYIIVEKESESEQENGDSENEIKYSYSLYQNNKCVRRTVASYEQEGREIELVLNVWESDGSKNRLTFKNYSKNETLKFYVSADFDGERVNFIVSIIVDGNSSSYSYDTVDGGHIGDGDRFDDDDYDDDEDDDHDHDDD